MKRWLNLELAHAELQVARACGVLAGELIRLGELLSGLGERALAAARARLARDDDGVTHAPTEKQP